MLSDAVLCKVNISQYFRMSSSKAIDESKRNYFCTSRLLVLAQQRIMLDHQTENQTILRHFPSPYLPMHELTEEEKSRDMKAGRNEIRKKIAEEWQ